MPNAENTPGAPGMITSLAELGRDVTSPQNDEVFGHLLEAVHLWHVQHHDGARIDGSHRGDKRVHV